MQFKHPELLYALFLLLIPIIVHLFHFRKFQKEVFTNVAFLKKVTLQTRKSSQLKKWLTLLARLLLLASLIFAFAQPYSSKTNLTSSESETVIYLDNSFSMQANGPKGELLKRAVQDVIGTIPEAESFSLITNETTYKHATIKTIKNDLLALDYSSKPLSYNAALLKCKKLFSPTSSRKDIVFISDFQQKQNRFNPGNDSLYNIHAVKMNPVNTDNISIDSAYISNRSGTTLELKVTLKNSGKPIENLPVSLFNDDRLIAKTSVALDHETETSFSIPANEIIDGKISIDDAHLQYDNSLFFNINKTSKINVLCINNEDDAFLKRLYTSEEFNYTSTPLNQLDYNILNNQNLMVLNELNTIPNSLASALRSFTKQGGTVIIIPSKDIDTETYNTLLTPYNLSINEVVDTEKQITTINYSHPLYANGVFEKQVTNFQYPKVNSYYRMNSTSGAAALQYEDAGPFLLESKGAYLFTASLSRLNSNFKNSPLIVPTFYNIARYSFKTPGLYYTIGNENTFAVSVSLRQDDILSLVKKDINLIPQQQYYNNKVVITTYDDPSESGIYAVNDKTKPLQKVSYNYNRDESRLVYQDLSNLSHITVSNSVSDSFNTLKSDTKVNELWKWFVIFALAFLLIEMLILKYFK